MQAVRCRWIAVTSFGAQLTLGEACSRLLSGWFCSFAGTEELSVQAGPISLKSLPRWVLAPAGWCAVGLTTKAGVSGCRSLQ